MSYLARFTGQIAIEPPLTWAQVRGLPLSLQDVQIVTHEDVTDDEAGYRKVVTGIAVAPITSDLFAGYSIMDELQGIVNACGTSHTFSGHIAACGEEGDLWRVTVRNREAVRITPRIIWD